MSIRFGLTPLALAMAILVGSNVRGQDSLPENTATLVEELSGDVAADCCAQKQQGGDCCSKPCSKTGCCSKTKAASGKKCCDKDCCDKDCCDKGGDRESGCCSGISCSTGKCGPGCCIKADCSAGKTGKCCQAKSCRAMGCCAAAMVRMVVPLPPLPVLMPLPLPPLPPGVFLSFVRLHSAQGTHCPYCQMMGLCPRQARVKAMTAARGCGSRPCYTPNAIYYPGTGCYGCADGSEVSGRSYVVEVRRMEKVGRQVRESRPCPDVSVQAGRPERVQIAGELILGDAGLSDRTKDTEEPNRSMLDLLVHPCGVDKVCLGLETDQLQPPTQACFGVGFRRCMRLVKTLELGKPTRVVLDRDCKGSERSWLEITVRNPSTVPSSEGKEVSTPLSCGTEASEPQCPRQALDSAIYPTLAPQQRPVGQPCPGAACIIQPWTVMPVATPVPPPSPSPYAAPTQSVWLPPQPIPPPAPPVPTGAPLPPPLPMASSADAMPPPAPIPPPAPTVMPYGPMPPLSDLATAPPSCPLAGNELRCVELSVVEERGKQMLRLETGDMRLTCEQITLERKGQGKVTLCASGSQVCLHGKTLQARADRVKVEDATTFSLLGKVQVHSDLSSAGDKGVVSETRGNGPVIRVNMRDGGISIRPVGR